jgi:hypothetical protein
MNFKLYLFPILTLVINPVLSTITVRILPFGKLIATGITAAVKRDPLDNLWFTQQKAHDFLQNPSKPSLTDKKSESVCLCCARCETYQKDGECGYLRTIDTLELTEIDNAKELDLLMPGNKENLNRYIRSRNNNIDTHNITIPEKRRLPHIKTLCSYTLSDEDFAALSPDETADLAALDTKKGRHRFKAGRKRLIATILDESREYIDCIICASYYRNGRCGYIIEEEDDCCGFRQCFRRLCCKSRRKAPAAKPKSD